MSPSVPQTIKALRTVADGTPTVVEIPFGSRDAVKNLGSEYVLSATTAVGLNPTDWKHAIGPWKPKAENICGCDSVGTAISVGSAVKHIKEGDRISGFVFGASNGENGSYAEAVLFNSAVCFVLPPGMSNAEGAAFPIPHLTAVQMLYMRLGLPKPSAPSTASPKQTILVWGGSTAVGHHLVQLAALSGFNVISTASPANHDYVLSLGASAVFDYRDPDVVKKIREAAGEEGVFAAVDPASEAGSNDACIDAIGKKGGRLITTLPLSDESLKRRSDVQAEFTLVYTELGYAFTFANVIDFPAMPSDTEQTKQWVSDELPLLLAGWKEGKGSEKYKGQKLRVLEGGLDRITEGLKIMEQGAYKAEKLVYNLV